MEFIIFHSIVRNFQKANNIGSNTMDIFSIQESLNFLESNLGLFQLLELFIGMLFLAKIFPKYGKLIISLCFYYNVFTDAHWWLWTQRNIQQEQEASSLRIGVTAIMLELGSSERPQCMSICIYCVINSIIFTLPKGLVFPKRQIL